MQLKKVKYTSCNATRRKSISGDKASLDDEDENARKVVQFLLWAAEGVYIVWLFLLPYAPVSFQELTFVLLL